MSQLPHSSTLPLPLQNPSGVGEDGAIDPTGIALRVARELLRAESRTQVVRILHAAVGALGGSVVPALDARIGALPYDVSLGIGEPAFVAAVAESVESRVRLARHLPGLIEDAVVAARRCDRFEQESRSASTDPLTGVASRRAIGPRLERAEVGDVVCLLDLDRFKELNDREGHAAGDQALRRFGGLLRAALRKNDFVGRYGGDEFVVVLSDVSAAVAADRLQELAAHWAETNGGRLTVSAGIAAVDIRGGTAAVKAADSAMYAAKRQGRNTVLAADPA